MSEDLYKKAADIIKEAEAIIITAGAGMGVDSGLPDYRGKEGFWREYPPIAKLGLSFEQMANPRWFEKNPKLAWAFYGHRFNLYRQTKPHHGFEILLNFARKMNNNYFVFTSNVDGQFQKAGFSENRIVEVHGSLNYLQCSKLCTNEIWQVDFESINVDMDKFEAAEPLPECPNCGSVARPNILMFNDWSWLDTRTDEQQRKFTNWLRNVENHKIVVVELGAGMAIQTIRLMSEKIIEEYNATLIRINPRDTFVPAGNIAIESGSLEALEKINELIK